MKLIVGLGNPGRGYTGNRHNLGFMCLNHFAGLHGIRFDRKQGKARIGSGEVAGEKLILARPQTYMNRSGEAVSRLLKKFKIGTDDLVVIQDDLDLPVGKIRIRQGGGSAGHRGIESIIAETGSPDFFRVRVGIGRPATSTDTTEIAESDIIDYVLSDFTPAEKRVITKAIPTVSVAISCLITEGLTAAMNKYN